MRDWLIDHASNDVPLMALFIMLFMSFWMLFCAARRPDSLLGKMMQDGEGKPSVMRLVTLWGFNISSWVVMRDTMRPEGVDVSVFGIFVAATFGGPIAGKLLERWNGYMPWTKGPAP